MRTKFSILALLPILITACGPTRIVTVSSNAGPVAAYSTTVTIPRAHTQTTTARVVAAREDISLFLDLQAVGAAFAQSSTIEQFEDLLNDASYMLNNLDLNNDGYVDYLRVMETVEGHNHVFVIQAVLAPDIYQDVCTLVAEMASPQVYVQVIGAPYIYGPNFIIEPVFYTTPLIYAHLRIAHYHPWRSPWHWNHFPHHYRHPAPVYLTHYQAYVATYMRNHRYCHEFHYAPKHHYPDYDRVSRELQRNDYGKQHPERSFTTRTANISNNNNTRVTNARDIYERQASSTVTSSSEPATRSNSRTATTSAATNSRTTSTNSRSANTATQATNSRSAGTATSTSRSTGSTSATRTGSTTGTSRSASSSGSSVSRSSAAPSSTARSASSSSSSSSRSSSTGSSSRTTVSSRVANSGSAETRTTTVSPSGSTSTTVRGSGSTSSSRSSGSSSSSVSRSSSSSSSSTATRSSSSGSSSRSSSTSSGSRSASSSSPARR